MEKNINLGCPPNKILLMHCCSEYQVTRIGTNSADLEELEFSCKSGNSGSSPSTEIFHDNYHVELRNILTEYQNDGSGLGR